MCLCVCCTGERLDEQLAVHCQMTFKVLIKLVRLTVRGKLAFAARDDPPQ